MNGIVEHGWINGFSNEKAKNNGYSATHRDGSAVELVVLSCVTRAWLIRVNEQGSYLYNLIEISSPSNKEYFLTDG